MLNSATWEFIRQHRSDDVRKLALQADRFQIPGLDFKMALQQIEGRQLVKSKIPDWFELDDILYPKRLSIEQSSSQTTAEYKASLLKGKTFIDLTGGFGVDHAFIAREFEQSIYIERQADLAEIAAHNFSILGLNHVKVFNADGLEIWNEIPEADCIFIDPARRSKDGKKVVSISDCEPDLSEIQDLLLNKAGKVLIKYSPMLDITKALLVLDHVTGIHVVSVENECKELLFVLERTSKSPEIHCLNFTKKGNQKDTFLLSEEKDCDLICTSELETYLYEPNASILKAGCFKSITRHYPVKKIHRDSHLYTSDKLISDFPGRSFRIISHFGFNKKELKSGMAGIEKANLSTRNFPLTTDALRKKLNLKDGGDVYLFATTIGEKRILIQCESLV
ncbi:class I SAM-dependent methyltransferase [Bacteroidales bacterium OttesenSCG-928-A17]|nr:class I SAM-dependent methyltransferase [Bacteroidales bacterium OttesenSCG-928-A17]